VTAGDDTQIQGDGVIAIIRQAERFLLIQRAPDILAGGMWCFVGGGLEPPESQQEAVVREVDEEVGLVVEPIRKVWEGLSPNRRWRLHAWTTDLRSTDVTPNPAEVANYTWLTPDELDAWPDLLPSVLELVRRA
jgi:8-oxo-dGTP diphosphatase/(d)CTP diphosphatase